MTTPTDTAAQPATFVRRADWTDENNYPPDDMADASAWAWEFLRRNREYQDDHQKWRDLFADVPARPLGDMPLTHYLCDPQPVVPDMPYWVYSQAHPQHSVLSIKDHIRLRWGVHALPDPALRWDEVYRANEEKSFDDDSRLRWLFTSNTVEVLRPPSIALADDKRPTFVTAACGSNEVLVRLTLGGNPWEYGESLSRALSRYFTGGNRHGSRRIPIYGEVKETIHPVTGKPVTGILLDPYEDGEFDDGPVIDIQESGWNKLDLRQASLQHTLRMADLLANLERGQLELQALTRQKETANVAIQPGTDLRKLGQALVKHFRVPENRLFDEKGRPTKEKGPNIDDPRTFTKWLHDAEELVCDREYLRLARADLKED
ncbi:transcriptional regulator domain-containing protein [Burkholderia gladioli]|uniref:transcriptional regulator domain-containing protein n=1 Tax=Burkholderia gladioli TaxID=28095 RepID=UPI001640739D|nr:DUF6499 domain-containing protein [Burkholderia gladioli]